jgi:type I restriction enzyme M protein
MDAAEYKHVALGLIFLKYISDRFDARIDEVKANPEEAPLLDDPDAARDLIISEGIFFVPERARWTFLKENAISTKPTRRADRSGHDRHRGGEPHAQGRAD